jgi:branched-chain amino acid transport system ATP-binding protein
MLRADDSWLSLREVSVLYHGKIAVERLSLDVGQGESLAVAGGNGAGKTSLLSAIAGVARKGQRIEGAVVFQGRDLQWGDVPGHIDAGIRLVPERDKVFSLLTVAENLQIGMRRRDRKDIAMADAFGWFPRLAERRGTLAGNLSGGEQQMLGIAMSLLASPSLLLLDEPTLGLAAPVIESLCDSLAKLRRDLGLTMIVAESDSQWLPRLVERAVVIDRGRLIGSLDRVDETNLDAVHDLMLGVVQPRVLGEVIRHAL